MRLGDYEVEGHLGAGGMSAVSLARDRAGRLVVLKQQLNPSEDQRLVDEGRVGMKLRHENVVQTLEMFEHNGRPVLVLEYVAGAPLAALRKLGPLHPAAVCRIGADIAAGLAALHGATDDEGRPLHILHRDVSPANIIVSPDGRARLIDLGIARFAGSTTEQTRTGDLRGTIRYLAPELFDGRQHSTTTDLWALGVCLHEAALGRPAVSGPEAAILGAILRRALLELQPGEGMPALLREVIQRLCSPPENRVPTAGVASHILAEAERSFGDGRVFASIAVRAVARAQGAGTVSQEQDLFERFAASTYCGVEEDDLFGPDAIATRATPAPVRVFDRPPSPRGPAPAPAEQELLLDQPLATPPPSSPGSQPSSRDSWDIPQPITGGAIPDEDLPVVAGSVVGNALRAEAPPQPSTSPAPATSDLFAPPAERIDEFAEGSGESSALLPIALVVVIAAAAVAYLVLR